MKLRYFLFVVLIAPFLLVGYAEAGNSSKACLGTINMWHVVVGDDWDLAYNLATVSQGWSYTPVAGIYLTANDVARVRGTLLATGSCDMYSYTNFHTIDLVEQCVCNTGFTECKNAFSYIFGTNLSYPAPSGFTVAEAGKKCEDLEKKKGCCCATLSEGSVTAEKKCVEVTAESPGVTPPCDGAVFGGAVDPLSKVELTSLSTDGTCNPQEKAVVGVVKPEDKSYDAGKELAGEASATLNPMKFKLGTAGVNDLIGRAIIILTRIMGSLLLLFYVYAGILWMTSAGNSERAGKAKQIVVWSTLGVVVVLASYMIVKFVFSVVG